MVTSDDNFAEYFTIAQAEALTAREMEFTAICVEAESTIFIP